MSNKSDKLKIEAVCDKETKGTFRFLIGENEHGISGSIYISKDRVDEVIQGKVKVNKTAITLTL